MKNANFRLLLAALVSCGLFQIGCPSKKPATAEGICGLQLDQARNVRVESRGEVPVIRVTQIPAAFMLTNRQTPGDKSCTFDLVGPGVRPERVFFRQGKLKGVNLARMVDSPKERVRVSYHIKSRSYGLVLVEPVVEAPDDSGRFEHGGLQFEVQGGAFLRIEENTPRVRSLGPATRIAISNPSKESLPVGLLVDNNSERLSGIKLQGPKTLKTQRIQPLVVQLKGSLGPGQQAILELVPRELPTPFSFLFGGDIKQETAIYNRLMKEVGSRGDPLFMLAVGDYTRNCLPWEYEDYFKTMEKVTFPVYYTKGNHETHCQGDLHYRRLFSPARFHFQVGDLLFVILDSNLPSDTGYRIGREQLDWLDKILTEHERVPWKLIGLHVPPDPLHGSPPEAPYLYNLDPGDSRALKKLATDHHVSYVLSGHAHLYARKAEDGVVYLTSGGGGAGLYSYNALKGYSFSLDKHLMILHVRENSIEEERIDLK